VAHAWLAPRCWRRLRGNYYVLAGDGIVGFVDTMSDPGSLERQVSGDLLSFMTDLLGVEQALPPG
jgi:hypothetical protein